ncbi:MAG: sigma-70 family RNA polymerase sigma factor [Planctomycetes bacterium]|nr:sigma-70 family RNA polymerase sigma factor [Planctomycetota bacterium]
MIKKHNTTMAEDRWGFPNTIWGVVLNAKDRDTKDYKEQIGRLISMYWMPAYKYIRMFWNKSNEEAKDLTQEYFTKFLEKDYLKNVSPDKGRFRTYIKATLKHFLINSRRDSMRQKRGGGSVTISSDGIIDEPTDSHESRNPSDYFDQEWARAVITRSIGELQDVLHKQDKKVYFDVFSSYYDARSAISPTYKELSKQFGIKETDVKNYLVYTKNLLDNIITNEVKGYVIDQKDVEDELKYLLSVRF